MRSTVQTGEQSNVNDDWELLVKTVNEEGGGSDLATECVAEYDRSDQGGTMARSTVLVSKTNPYSHSERQEYGWRAFCFELLCGMAAIVWYVLFLAERTTLRALTWLEEIAASRPNNNLQRERGSHVLFQGKFNSQSTTVCHEIGSCTSDDSRK